MPFQFTCSNCHRQFGSASRRERRFCSRACMYEFEKIRRNYTCARCGKPFDRPASIRKVQWCSRACLDDDKRDAALSPERFWAKVDRSSAHGCWPWIGLHDHAGYGVWGASHHRQRGLAHRRAWEMASGANIPQSMVIGHTCDTPACVRNDDSGIYIVRGRPLPRYGHLFMGTTADNMHDKVDKGRNRNAQGAKYPRDHEASLYFREIIEGVWMPILVLAEIRLLPHTLEPAPNKYVLNQ